MSTSYRSVNALLRGLAVLRALGRLGEATTIAIAQATGIPRPTTHRLLETLRAAGYVQRRGLRDTYRLTLLVRSLAEGYVDEDWIVEIAEPVLAKLRAEVVWPTDIATYDHGKMVVRSTTHSNNPLSIERVTSGREIRMLSTATGRVYLAFCQERERKAILETLAAVNGAGREEITPAALERELAATRERGYGVRIKGKVQPKTSSIAVPVMHDDQVLACININWITSAITLETAVQRYLGPLRKAARRIEEQYKAYSTEASRLSP